MKTSFIPTRMFILAAEAGYSDDPCDPGNWTGNKIGVGRLVGSNKGVSAAALAAYLGRNVDVGDMRNVSEGSMSAIMGASYWNTLNANEIPIGLDLLSVDHGYSRGAGTAARLLQKLVGVEADGHIGEVTIGAVLAVTATDILKRSTMLDVKDLQVSLGVVEDGNLGARTADALHELSQPGALLVAFCAARVRDYRGLDGFKRFGAGWLNRVSSAMHAAGQLSRAT